MRWLKLAKARAHLFWAKVDRSGDCWPWKGGKYRNGTGRHHITLSVHRSRTMPPNQKQIASHRLAWQLEHGLLRKGETLVRACDTVACCRPSHYRRASLEVPW